MDSLIHSFLTSLLFFLNPSTLYLIPDMVEPIGIEPMTSCVQGRRSPS